MILSQRVDAGHEGLARVDRGALGLDTVVIEVEQSRGVNLAAPVFFDPVLGHRRERAPDAILPVDRLPENEQLVAPAVQRLPLRAGRADQETEALLADVTKHERAHAGWAVTVGGGEDAGVDERITSGAGALAVGDDLGDRIHSHAWQAYTIRGVTDSIARLDALATRCLTATDIAGGSEYHAGGSEYSAGGSEYMVWRLWGAGPPVVLLHGGSGSWTHWARNIMPLARHFTVWVPDLPGFGDSGLPPGVETAEALADIVSSGLDDVVSPPAPVSLVGFSFGGIIAGLVAARQRDRVRTLVLIGAGGLALGAAPTRQLARVTPNLTLAEARAAHRENLEILMIADPAQIDEAAVDVQMENVRRTRFKIGAIPFSDALVRALPRISARLVAVWGARDVFPASPPELRHATLAAHHPEVDFRLIDGAGHWANWEAADAVNAMLLDVLGAGTPARA